MIPRFLFLLALPLIAQAQTFLAQQPSPELAMIFRPFETDSLTMSPDGRHLAYTERQGERLDLLLRDLEKNRLVRVPLANAQVEDFSGHREKKPARLTFLQWATEDRLIFNLNGENVWSIRADGSDPRSIANPLTFRGHPSIAGDTFSIGVGGAVGPPNHSALDTLTNYKQHVNVVKLRRGQRYVFVEAVMKAWDTIGGRAGVHGSSRAVLRVDVTNGRSEVWGDAPRTGPMVTDQEGHPRLIQAPDNGNNSSSLTSIYLHSSPQGKWQPLDDLLGHDSPFSFRSSPKNHLGTRSIPLAFDYNSDVLYIASNALGDTFGIYGLDTKRKVRTDIAIETPVADLFDPLHPRSDTLVFDDWKKQLVGIRYTGAERATLWLDDDLADVQATVDTIDEKNRWEILEWDQARSKFLVLSSNNFEPGTFHVFDRAAPSLIEVSERARWLTDVGRNPSTSFGFQTPAGVNLSGNLTLPRKPLLQRPPLVVLCHDGPWSRDLPGYNREAQALAWMGFIVLQVNFRGSTGFGQKHLNGLQDGFDSVALDDVLAAIDAVTPEDMDRRLVAIMGTGYGGYLALRAMQLHPTRFRCAVAINAPTDLAVWANSPQDTAIRAAQSEDSVNARGVWHGGNVAGPSFEAEFRRAFFGGNTSKLRDLSPLNHPEKISGPVMIVQGSSQAWGRGRELSEALRRLGRAVVYLNPNDEEMADLPHARAALFTQIHAFLNENIYNYAVTLGDAVEAK